MIFQLLRLWWYCWKNELRISWYEHKNDRSYYVVHIWNPNVKNIATNGKLKWQYEPSLRLLVSKHPCREPYKVYNRMRKLIRDKLIRSKKYNIKAYYHDFGTFEYTAFC